MNAMRMRRTTTRTPICIIADELSDDFFSSSGFTESFVSPLGSVGSVVDDISTLNERVLEFMLPDASELLIRRVHSPLTRISDTNSWFFFVANSFEKTSVSSKYISSVERSEVYQLILAFPSSSTSTSRFSISGAITSIMLLVVNDTKTSSVPLARM